MNWFGHQSYSFLDHNAQKKIYSDKRKGIWKNNYVDKESR